MGAFFRELMRVSVYKRSQGRITRQVTFAALAVMIALGLWRLGGMLVGLDPTIKAEPAKVVCSTKAARFATAGDLVVTGNAGKATVAIHADDTLAKVAEAVNAARRKTGVVAVVEGKSLTLASAISGANQKVAVQAPKGLLQFTTPASDGVARGTDAVNFGLRYLIPGVLLALGLWASFRLVNVPAFADFLIAVEAEMNKVSWPTRGELTRASVVVLIMIFALAIVLAGFDFAWALLFKRVLNIL